MRRCTKCIMPESYPEIKFDEQGVCNFCREYKKYNVKGERALKRSILANKHKNSKYDCIVPLSGGRESSYVLFYIRKKLDLNPLAVQYDNDFVSEQARTNIANAISILCVDFTSVQSRKKLRRKIVYDSFKLNINKDIMKTVSSFCSHCDICEESAVYGVSAQQDIPVIVWGDSQEEITAFDPIFGYYHKRNDNKSNELLSKLNEKLKILFSPLMINYIRLKYNSRQIKKEFHCDWYAKSPALRAGLHFFDYVEHNENIIVQTIKEELKWDKSPYSLVAWRFDCLIAIISEYFKKIYYGFNKSDVDLSNQIRKGLINREDALKLIVVDDKSEFEKLEHIFIEMGFSKKEIQMLKPPLLGKNQKSTQSGY